MLATYDCDRDHGCVWEYKFDVLELAATPPVLCEPNPVGMPVASATAWLVVHCGEYSEEGKHPPAGTAEVMCQR